MADQRERILDAAATLFEDQGIAAVSRRTIAAAADVSTRSVTAVGHDRQQILAEVVAGLPFPPTSQRMRQQAQSAAQTPLATILTVAQDAFGAPASVWDSRELQAVVLAPFDEALADVVRERVAMRWGAAAAVIGQLRGAGAVDERIDDDAATLHLLAVGAGLALLEPIVPRSTEASAWLGLVARLLESLAADDPPGPAHSGRRLPWRVRIETTGSPGATARVMRVLALLRADVLTMFSHALSSSAAAPSGSDAGGGTASEANASSHHPPPRPRSQLLDLIIDVPDDIDRRAMEHALASVSQRVLVTPGTVEDTADVVTRVLDGATGLAENPDAAPQAAADLVLADSWQVLPASEGPDSSADVMRLQWTPDAHVILSRPGSPFVAVERLRASALLRLVDALSRAPAGSGGFGWRETARNGQPVAIRLARPWDADNVAGMHDRCSEESRYERYFAPVSQWREDQLRRLSGGHRGATLVAINDSGDIVGLGNVFPEQPERQRTAEIAVIVEDAWQGQGLGTSLLQHLIALAQRMEFEEVAALVLATNTRMIRMLENTDLTWTQRTDADLGPTIVRMTAQLN
jgi:AcrR family transcriptional regulator/RimJ/RimL family protein N-acetyltransferase